MTYQEKLAKAQWEKHQRREELKAELKQDAGLVLGFIALAPLGLIVIGIIVFVAV